MYIDDIEGVQEGGDVGENQVSFAAPCYALPQFIGSFRSFSFRSQSWMGINES